MPEQANGTSPAGEPLLAPQPGPCQVFASVVQLTDGTRRVMLTVVGTSGTTSVYLPPDVAAQIGNMIGQQATLARSGLVLP